MMSVRDLLVSCDRGDGKPCFSSIAIRAGEESKGKERSQLCSFSGPWAVADAVASFGACAVESWTLGSGRIDITVFRLPSEHASAMSKSRENGFAEGMDA